MLNGLHALNVGQRNAEFVLDYLSVARIRILARDLNDSHPRKVVFFPRSGRVMVRKLNTSAAVIECEQQYAMTLGTIKSV